jgi:hypothetical protein
VNGWDREGKKVHELRFSRERSEKMRLEHKIFTTDCNDVNMQTREESLLKIELSSKFTTSVTPNMIENQRKFSLLNFHRETEFDYIFCVYDNERKFFDLWEIIKIIDCHYTGLHRLASMIGKWFAIENLF